MTCQQVSNDFFLHINKASTSIAVIQQSVTYVVIPIVQKLREDVFRRMLRVTKLISAGAEY
jgi:hypothetical protein